MVEVTGYCKVVIAVVVVIVSVWVMFVIVGGVFQLSVCCAYKRQGNLLLPTCSSDEELVSS